MSMHALGRGAVRAAIAGLFFLLISLAGCGGGAGGGGSSAGSGTLQVVLADAPPGPQIQALNVTISRVEANVNSAWQAVTTDPKTFNLLDLVKNEALLGSATLPAGHYTQIRLFPSDATILDSAGKTQTVEIPSAVKTGIKLNVDYDINDRQVTTILLDFNVQQSLIVQGNGQYRLQPVIPVVVKALSGTVTGMAQDGEAAASGATVTAVDGAGNTRSTTTLADGSFKVWALMPGTCALTVRYTDASGAAKTATATAQVKAGENTDVGTLTLAAASESAGGPPPPPAP